MYSKKYAISETSVVIPAIKKNVAFADDLIKKLNGISLVQRAINLAISFVEKSKVIVLTDSEEISLICRRNGVRFSLEPSLNIQSTDFLKDLRETLAQILSGFRSMVWLWPYSPMVTKSLLESAFEKFQTTECDYLFTVREEDHRIYSKKGASLHSLFNEDQQRFLVEVRAFQIYSSEWLLGDRVSQSAQTLVLGEEFVEIKGYQDWWVCEKLLKKKRIVFHVIGYAEVGLGHLYRSLALAHEITDHEVHFLCTTRSRFAANQIAGYEYPVECVEESRLLETLLSLKPDLIIHDVLNTQASLIQGIQSQGIKTVCFEDLGEGGKRADLTINELYDDPLFEGKNVRWGHRYYFLRDEFLHANVNHYTERVSSILVTFGGSDPKNLTLRCVKAIFDYCRDRNIQIQIVTGPGYIHLEELQGWLKSKNSPILGHTNATGVISHIMEEVQVAISSNGRTVYELAHMNVPAIILPQHEREKTHRFARTNNGFYNLGLLDPGEFSSVLKNALVRLVEDIQFRKDLFRGMEKFDFSRNKTWVAQEIQALLKE